MVKTLCYSLLLIFTFSSCQSQDKPKHTFPFTLQNNDGRLTVMAAVNEAPLYPKYFNLFQKYGYTGNGQSWTDLIQQILEKNAPDLLSRIDFDPEAGAFFAYAKNEDDRKRFLQIVVPIFSNMEMLEEHIKKADRTKFDD